MGYKCVRVEGEIQKTNETLLGFDKRIADPPRIKIGTKDPKTGHIIWRRQSKAEKEILAQLLKAGFWKDHLKLLEDLVDIEAEDVGRKSKILRMLSNVLSSKKRDEE